ncbi:hypothetical protein BN1723_012442 [Verticillium longisporum]|uniref:Uncharacterized protein n=1 Tax=Verticillium longisporum TaxID=100787 RepID=A0A0G4LJ51_VERLO|nr:hypothetical protein BN1723_012442 [Verticillium longisporum]CRK29895.1 hypothetical protein BN1708_018382 [Verticillium longisporum]
MLFAIVLLPVSVQCILLKDAKVRNDTGESFERVGPDSPVEGSFCYQTTSPPLSRSSGIVFLPVVRGGGATLNRRSIQKCLEKLWGRVGAPLVRIITFTMHETRGEYVDERS